MQIDLVKSMILATISGSRAYGISHAESDTDVVGIAIAPPSFYNGFLLNFDQKRNDALIPNLLVPNDFNSERKVESTIYDIRKFFKLCADCNPNIIEIVYTPQECIRFIAPAAERILENRELFLSKKARFTFSGYAYAQLKRIETHRKWLLNPRTTRPERKDYKLSEIQSPQIKQAESMIRSQISQWQFNDLQVDQATVLEIKEKIVGLLSHLGYPAETYVGTVFDAEEQLRYAALEKIGFDTNLMELIQREHEYAKDLLDWRNYEQWKRTRNAERAVLEGQYGYDTKHAAHLVRLMRMAEEILSGKGVLVRRPDAEELKAIRRGEWTYEQLMEWVTQMDKRVADLYEQDHGLPKKPDLNKLNDLCVEIVEGFRR